MKASSSSSESLPGGPAAPIISSDESADMDTRRAAHLNHLSLKWLRTKTVDNMYCVFCGMVNALLAVKAWHAVQS